MSITPVTLLVISPPDQKHLSILQQLPPDTKITISNDPAVLKAAAPEAHAVLNCTGKGDLVEQIWPEFRRLRWVHSLSAGVEHQLFSEFVQSDIPLTNSRGVFRESLGEFAIAAALFFAKDLRRMVRSQEAGRWDQFDVDELCKQTMGVVGYGEIGRAVARRGKALGMRILALRRRTAGLEPDGIADQNFERQQIGDLMAAGDVIVVSTPLTPETRGLIGDRELRRMKPTGIIINVGRGPVIDEAALVAALTEKRIRGAALDVFNQEPVPVEHPFWKLDNLLLSPHCADHTVDWLQQGMEFFVGEFRRFQAGEPLLNLVDKQAGY